MVAHGPLLTLISAALLLGIPTRSSGAAVTDPATQPVQDLIDRVLGPNAFTPTLQIIDKSSSGADVFELDSDGGGVVLRGSSGVALASAFAHYAKTYCGCDFAWQNAGGFQVASFPVDSPPVPAAEHVERLAPWNYFSNTCTHSYSFAWYDWNDWEHLLDWAALGGVNLFLAFTGQEAVLDAVFKEQGVSQAGMDAYFSGPAFLAWNRMSNMRGWGGPLSAAYIQGQAALQRQILARMAEFEITPVLPGFSGRVPAEMTTLYPSVNITRLPNWSEEYPWPDEYCCTYQVEPSDPTLDQIGKRFLELQNEMWGNVTHIYNVDVFNEVNPESHDPDYLAASSAATYASLAAGDPDAVWLMQGWLFIETHEGYWWEDADITAYLSGPPKDSFVVLDLAAERAPIWQTMAANGVSFIWCMLHNFGGNRALYGNMTAAAVGPFEAQGAEPDFFLGTGLTMEAIDTNPSIYEFMNENTWRTAPADVVPWSADYAARRYGNASTAAASAWATLVTDVYGPDPIYSRVRRSIIGRVPAMNTTQDTTVPATPLVGVWASLLSAITDDGLDPAQVSYDLVDVGRQVMSNLYYDLFLLFKHHAKRRDLEPMKSLSATMVELMADWDTLLLTDDGYLLGAWIEKARKLGKAGDESDLFEFNARALVTMWGPAAPSVGGLNDYAQKDWASLVSTYYAERWSMWLNRQVAAVADRERFNETEWQASVLAFSEAWGLVTEDDFPAEAVGDVVEVSQGMFGKYTTTASDYEATAGVTAPGPREILQAWTSDLGQLEFVCNADPGCAGFDSTGRLFSAVDRTIAVGDITLYKKPILGAGAGDLNSNGD